MLTVSILAVSVAAFIGWMVGFVTGWYISARYTNAGWKPDLQNDTTCQ